MALRFLDIEQLNIYLASLGLSSLDNNNLLTNSPYIKQIVGMEFHPNAYPKQKKGKSTKKNDKGKVLSYKELLLGKLNEGRRTQIMVTVGKEATERMEDEGDVATVFTLARILSNIPASRGGPTSLVTFDIHALQERFYFGDTILPCFESGIPLLKSRLQSLPDSDNISFSFPDDGAWKRFHKQLQHYPTFSVSKAQSKGVKNEWVSGDQCDMEPWCGADSCVRKNDFVDLNHPEDTTINIELEQEGKREKTGK